jgi:hypothetical protein
VLEHIRAIKASFTDFTFAGDPDPRTLNSAKSVPDAFLEMTAVAIEASAELQALDRVDPADLRDVANFSLAFTPVAEELELMARAVRHTIAIRRATVGQLALQVYQFVKTFARKTSRQILMPHYENMRVALGRSRPKPKPDPTTPPLPVPPKVVGHA